MAVTLGAHDRAKAELIVQRAAKTWPLVSARCVCWEDPRTHGTTVTVDAQWGLTRCVYDELAHWATILPPDHPLLAPAPVRALLPESVWRRAYTWPDTKPQQVSIPNVLYHHRFTRPVAEVDDILDRAAEGVDLTGYILSAYTYPAVRIPVRVSVVPPSYDEPWVLGEPKFE